MHIHTIEYNTIFKLYFHLNYMGKCLLYSLDKTGYETKYIIYLILGEKNSAWTYV